MFAGIIACRLVGYNNAMCLIAFAWQTHPRYPLILVANRDEFYERPTATAHFWEDNPDILGGRDLQAGGTWLGVRRDGRWSAVTNYREAQQETAPSSRGALTTGCLEHAGSLVDYGNIVLSEGSNYSPFNLLLGDDQSLLYCSNRTGQLHTLDAGIFTLSNHLLDTPWPKANHARDALQVLIRDQKPDPGLLLKALQRDTPYDDELLPDTGVGIELERLLSPPFIHSEHYGTRSTTVFMKDLNGQCHVLEQSYQQGGAKGELKEFHFTQKDQ